MSSEIEFGPKTRAWLTDKVVPLLAEQFATALAAKLPAPAPRAASGGASVAGVTFGPFGRSKGMPIAGASLQDLEWYANAARASLSNPEKERFHEKERVQLAALEAEIARQNGAPPPSAGNPGPDDDSIPF